MSVLTPIITHLCVWQRTLEFWRNCWKHILFDWDCGA